MASGKSELRNLAIIAHVDHGKTTLVDRLFQECGALARRDSGKVRLMDSFDQERERGITILAKCTAIEYRGVRINIVDTPGHADFGGEVERVLSMVDSVLLLVDAVEGPMPQTRFVTRKAFEAGLNPIVVINKIDRDGARPYWVLDRVFDLFDRLGANESQLDFPVIYASGLDGRAGLEPDQLAESLSPLLDLVLERVPPPDCDAEGPLQLQICTVDYSSYVGVIGIGRIQRGELRRNMAVMVVDRDGNSRSGRVLQIMRQLGMERIQIEQATAGDIVSVSGLDGLRPSDTLCAPECLEPLPPLSVDEPTVSVTIQVNDSPFAGQDGKYVTSRKLLERLDEELLHDVALKVESGGSSDRFIVSGRGELHLSVLIETMRREGFEMGVSRPEVICREVNGVVQEPWELLVVDCEEAHQGAVMEALGERRAELKDMLPDARGRVRLEYLIPSRGLIGFRTQFMSLCSGSGILTHVFDHYAPVRAGSLGKRRNGVLVSMAEGKALGYALYNLQERGRLLIGPNVAVYEGQIVGIHSRENDLPVNPTRAKQLTNIRAAGSDENILLTPPIRLSLEQALEFIDDDELIEVTPVSIRLRKRLLKESERRKAAR